MTDRVRSEADRAWAWGFLIGAVLGFLSGIAVAVHW